MKYSSTLLLAAAFATSISAFALPAPQSGSNCDLSSLQDCVQPLTAQVSACSLTDLDCACGALADLVACYDNNCPGEAPPEVNTAVEACNSAGQDVASASSDLASATSRIASATSRAGLGDDEETSTEAGETTTQSLVDTESTATETAEVTKTTSGDEETSAAGGAATNTRRPTASGTSTGGPATQSGGAAQNVAVPAMGGLLAIAAGVVAWL